MICEIPIIRDDEHDLSGCCKNPAGLPQLDRIHRKLPARPLPPGDEVVLQDEFGAAILDELTGRVIYDDWKR